MLTEKSIYVIHNDLRGYTSPVKKWKGNAGFFIQTEHRQIELKMSFYGKNSAQWETAFRSHTLSNLNFL